MEPVHNRPIEETSLFNSTNRAAMNKSHALRALAKRCQSAEEEDSKPRAI